MGANAVHAVDMLASGSNPDQARLGRPSGFGCYSPVEQFGGLHRGCFTQIQEHGESNQSGRDRDPASPWDFRLAIPIPRAILFKRVG